MTEPVPESDGLERVCRTPGMTARERKWASLGVAVTGLLMNLVLAAAKLVAGYFASSIAITADGWNNLSDSLSSVISIVSIRMTAKPADKKHPFGYARFEYIASSVIALGMLTVAVQVGYRAILRTLSPAPLATDYLTFLALSFSILVKLIQYFFYRAQGKKLVSTVFMAASRDSMADVYATSGVLVATLLYAIFGINVDGPAGLIVSLLIAWSAVSIMRKTATLLIGGKPSSEMTALISEKILGADPRIVGVHDLIVHDYGPGSLFATAHVELDSRSSFIEAHLIIDCVERMLLRDYDIHLLLHADPYYVDDAEHQALHAQLQAVARELAPGAVIHSLHLFLSDQNVRVASFDVSVPGELAMTEEEFFRAFRDKVRAYDPDLVLWITLDREYMSVVSDDRPNLHVTAGRD
ncbi:MAG TPA: cation diffusion facilitator family transporter [Bacillota bacterium]|jgi:cation diffusion facilitator family transporter|nr:cation transporter [Fastidiosipila sp.]HPX93262.1 cation diffusion facilitator family transporter [Bacillota bacterium]HQB80921.1 cation diffusion facilitator family transporter [Bacillota bacterium]